MSADVRIGTCINPLLDCRDIAAPDGLLQVNIRDRLSLSLPFRHRFREVLERWEDCNKYRKRLPKPPLRFLCTLETLIVPKGVLGAHNN